MPEFAENYLGYLLARCSYEVSAEFHQQLKSRGVSVLTWRVLSSIRYKQGSVNELAAKVLVNQSTLSKALDRMERDNLIRRQRDPDFRSRTLVEITPTGIKLVDHLIELANAHEADIVDHLSCREMTMLRNLLSKLIQDKP